jgi:ankyrin repeat protein
MEKVVEGDIPAIKRQLEKVGIPITYLVDDKLKHNALFYAALIKDETLCLRVLDFLGSLGLDATQVDALNQTPLFYAARENKGEVVAHLLRGGCQVNHVDTYGQTAIFYAARESHVDTCRRLVSLGAESDVIDVNGQTPLYYAIKGIDLETVEFFIRECGVDVNNEDNKGITPLVFAKRTGKKQMVNLLMEHGAKTSAEEVRRMPQGRLMKKAGATSLSVV